MKSLRIFLLVVSFVCAHCIARADSPKDPRVEMISEKELRNLIKKAPIQSEAHSRLIARAQASKLTKEAYEQYTLLWKEHPDNAFTNLLRGITAEQLWWQASFPKNNIKLSSQQNEKLFKIAKACLEKAAKKKPYSPRAKAAYGMFLWKHLGSEYGVKGESLVKEAIKLDSKYARAYATLGEIHATPSRKTYNPQLAEKELRKAIELDATYSYPRYILVRFFIGQKRYKEAKAALDDYMALVTPELAKSTEDFFKPRIETGISTGGK